jgi:hypothetical protein
LTAGADRTLDFEVVTEVSVLVDERADEHELHRHPDRSATATLILSFAIGLNLTLYQLVGAALLRPPAVRSAAEVARFHRVGPHSSSTSVPYPVAEFVEHNNAVLASVMVEAGSTIAWGSDAAEQIEASFVSTNWFDELGYGPLLGRVLRDDIDRTAGIPSVVLGYTFWQSRLGGDPAVIGTTAYLDRKPVTIVGVAPKTMPGLDFDVPAIFVPIVQREYFYPRSHFLAAWNTDTVAMYGRFRTGLSRTAVRDGLRPVMQAIAREHGDVEPNQWLEPPLATDNFTPATERREIVTVASLIAALTSLVLIVAAANLGNLVTSRAMGRVRELGVRMALGARRGRIVRQLIFCQDASSLLQRPVHLS